MDLVDYRVTNGRPPDEVLLTPDKMVAVMWLGIQPTPEELIEIGYKK